jgi:hypothetical protein
VLPPPPLQGALVANYPWDNTPDGEPAYTATPDDATFRHLAATYASRNPAMKASPVRLRNCLLTLVTSGVCLGSGVGMAGCGTCQGPQQLAIEAAPPRLYFPTPRVPASLCRGAGPAVVLSMPLFFAASPMPPCAAVLPGRHHQRRRLVQRGRRHAGGGWGRVRVGAVGELGKSCGGLWGGLVQQKRTGRHAVGWGREVGAGCVQYMAVQPWQLAAGVGGKGFRPAAGRANTARSLPPRHAAASTRRPQCRCCPSVAFRSTQLSAPPTPNRLPCNSGLELCGGGLLRDHSGAVGDQGCVLTCRGATNHSSVWLVYCQLVYRYCGDNPAPWHSFAWAVMPLPGQNDQ